MTQHGDGRKAVTLGSAPDNDWVFELPMVSAYHARIYRDGNRLVLEDLGSTNGTFVRGAQIGSPTFVAPGEVIGLGSHSFTLEPRHLDKLRSAQPTSSHSATTTPPMAPPITPGVPITATPTSPPLHSQPSAQANEGPTAQPGAPSISLGYEDDNAVVIPLPQVSGHHCRIWRDGDQMIIEDLGSSNGTFVNGQRITRAYVKRGDQIGLGSYRFMLDEAVTEKLDDAPTNTGSPRTQIGQLPAVMTKPLRVGRDDSPDINDIVINAPMVSNEHALLTFMGTGWRVVDLGSTNGTYINSRSHRITEGVATESDVLFFGSYRFPISRLADYIPDVAGHKPSEMSLPTDKKVMTIGRDESCDITIDAPQVSRRHARLTRTADGFRIEDLGSANGTYVGGRRISKANIGPRDWVGLGSYQIRFDADAGTVERNYRGDIMLQADGVTVKVDRGRKTILHGISFTAYPTEFIGLMGPSGAGKTTLLMALNGYLPPTHGRSLINGLDLYANYNAFRGNIGYVPQDDIIHRELTVWEALYYTAKLRLPPDTSNKEIESIILRVLDQLEIAQTRDVLIGSPEKKGISGGQRKRVNLAQELITQPSLLLLDEPTSGLASEDTINVMKLLRRLADEGRTIILTIHQPSLEAYRRMDNIVYLADGHLVYYGPTYPDSILYFNPDTAAGTPEGDRILADPGNALKPLAEDKRQGMDMSIRAQQYLGSQQFQEYVERRRQGIDDVSISGGSKQKTRRRFGIRQWLTLTQRYFTVKRKDVANTFILLAQAPIIAVIIALVFWGETDDSWGRNGYEPFALFLLSISAVWFGCSNSAREIVSELAIYRRERMVNLKIPSYVMSKFTVLGFVCAVQCLMLLVITYPTLGFQGNFFELFAILMLCSSAGLGMGLVLSALVRTSEAAIGLVPLLLIPQVILGGLIMPIEKLSFPMKVASIGMISRWGFEGLLHAEDRYDAFEIPEKELEKKHKKLVKKARKKGQDPRLIPPVQPPEHPLDRYFDDAEVGSLGDACILITFNFLLLIGVLIILKIRDPDHG